MLDRKRARELREAIAQLRIDLEEARQDDAPGASLFVHDLKQSLWELEHQLFLTGVTDEA